MFENIWYNDKIRQYLSYSNQIHPKNKNIFVYPISELIQNLADRCRTMRESQNLDTIFTPLSLCPETALSALRPFSYIGFSVRKKYICACYTFLHDKSSSALIRWRVELFVLFFRMENVELLAEMIYEIF